MFQRLRTASAGVRVLEHGLLLGTCMKVPLVCFPFAGAGAAFFGPWATRLAAHCDVVPVRLPGREQRYFEVPLTSVPDAVDDALRSLRPRLEGRHDVVLFGHSLGAVLAYELAVRLQREGGFGVVYVAEQREPVKWRVARKIVKFGMATWQVVARFEA